MKMTPKGNLTKKNILNQAIHLFSQKGYASVTMEDIREASGLSRGGLYRYFQSTKKIFEEILINDKDQNEQALNDAIASGVPAGNLFQFFIEQQKSAILNHKGKFNVAVYEFFQTEPEMMELMNDRFSAAVRMLKTLIEYGNRDYGFSVQNTQETARFAVLYLEGIINASALMPMSEKMLDEQFAILYSILFEGKKVQKVENET